MSEKPPSAPRKHKPGPGRGNVWKPTDEQRLTAKFLSAGGATQKQIGDYLGIDKDTVALRLRAEWDYGQELKDLALVGKLYRKAMGSGIHSADGDTACLIFLAKTRLGMWDRPPALPSFHPNDFQPQVREELSVSVTYRYSTDPEALAPPPADRLPRQIEATATKAD